MVVLGVWAWATGGDRSWEVEVRSVVARRKATRAVVKENLEMNVWV